MDKKKKLTLFEASAMVAGLGVGGGVMAVPYLASLNGIGQVIIIMFVAYFLSVLLHLMVAEIAVRDGGNLQLVELFGKYVFRGRIGPAFTWLFFGLIVVVFYALLSGYIVGCGEILVKLFADIVELPLWTCELLAYAIAAGVVFFGLKVIGMSEKYAIIGISILIGVLAIASFFRPLNTLVLWSMPGKQTLAFYGMLMFSFACFFSVPQAVEGLSHNRRLVPWAVVIGIGFNFTFALVITVMAMLVSKEVTEVAIIGWGDAIGKWALLLGSFFGLLAMLTSYWGVSYALSVIVKERLGWSDRLSWLAATLPTLLMAVSGLMDFLGFMRLAGGGVAVMVAIMVIPALRTCRKEHGDLDIEFDLGIWGSAIFQVLVIAAYLVMAVGSVIPINAP